MDLSAWLQARADRLRTLWSEEIRARGVGRREDVDRLVDGFVDRIVQMLPLLLGPARDSVEPLWVRACELFGVLAVDRGLAAGEIIDELHVLRELVIRELYRDPPRGGQPLSLRDILRLNRALDRAVTHASVGHTDAMFFQFFEKEAPSGVSPHESVAGEVAEQLEAIGGELAEALGAARPAGRKAAAGG